MRMELPEHVKTIIQKLESHGYEGPRPLTSTLSSAGTSR